jgi:hypothetical protein
MNFLDEKVLIALVSVGVGWLLAQGTALAKDLWNARKLKQGLLDELEDIKEQMRRVERIYARKLQVYALKGIEPSASVAIHNMFFTQYFKDVFSHLNREQRLSYQLIHATLDTFNKQNEKFADFTAELFKNSRGSTDQPADERTVELWGDQVIAIYKNVMNILWHIEHHLRNKHGPKLDFLGPIHESYLKFEEDLDQDVKNIIQGAKNLKREDFEKFYDEGLFRKPDRAA